MITLEKIHAGELVQEYVGEVIDEKVTINRMNSWGAQNPGNDDYYIMKLMPGWYIDARLRASMSRFINHSCDPNCQLKKISVAGLVRIAIVAGRYRKEIF